MKRISYLDVEITGGFWAEKQQLVADVSLYNIHKRFSETGRFEAIKCVKNDRTKPHIFWDSDVAKWLESAAYVLAKKRDEKLYRLADEAIVDICKNQLECGYFNSYFQVYEPESIFCKRTEHELYCAGHLIEAAVALREAGVDERLFGAIIKYADYIYKRFFEKRDAGFVTCGHPEIELALAKLFEATGDEKYLELAAFFIDQRGKHNEPIYDFATPAYHLDHVPVRQMKTAEGHAVRALYLYTAAADVARLKGDGELLAVCQTLFSDIITQKMYATGGVGSSFNGETFTFPYHLPNETAYAETCAAIALCLFCDRLSGAQNRAVYHEVFERAVYNGVLSGMSADGKGFFYVNPLEMHEDSFDYNSSLKTKLFHPIPQRLEVFDCSCCPPNLTRFIAQIGGFVWGEEDGAVLINQYVSSNAKIGSLTLQMQSTLPFEDKVSVKATGCGTLKLRVPAWSGGVSLSVNAHSLAPDIREGYIAVRCAGEAHIELDFMARPHFLWANENVWHDCGRKALECGPLLMCAESVDNGKNLRSVHISSLERATIERGQWFSITVPAERLKAGSALYSNEPPIWEECELRLIPYFMWANRGKGDMQVWWL